MGKLNILDPAESELEEAGDACPDDDAADDAGEGANDDVVDGDCAHRGGAGTSRKRKNTPKTRTRVRRDVPKLIPRKAAELARVRAEDIVYQDMEALNFDAAFLAVKELHEKLCRQFRVVSGKHRAPQEGMYAGRVCVECTTEGCLGAYGFAADSLRRRDPDKGGGLHEAALCASTGRKLKCVTCVPHTCSAPATGPGVPKSGFSSVYTMDDFVYLALEQLREQPKLTLPDFHTKVKAYSPSVRLPPMNMRPQ